MSASVIVRTQTALVSFPSTSGTLGRRTEILFNPSTRIDHSSTGFDLSDVCVFIPQSSIDLAHYHVSNATTPIDMPRPIN